MYSTLSTLNTTTEVLLSKTPCVCTLQKVYHPMHHPKCVCTLDGLKAEHKFWVSITILGRMSRHFHFLSLGLSMYFISNYGTLVTILTSVQQSGVHWLVVLGTSSEKVLIHSAQCTTLSYCLKVLNSSTSSTFSKYFPDSWMKVLSIFWGNAWWHPTEWCENWSTTYANDFMSHTDVACRVQTGRLLSTHENRQVL